MTEKIAGPEIERLISLLGRMPGFGRRSARKAALALLKRREDLLLPLADAMREAAEKLTDCEKCGNIDTISPCTICSDPRRDQSLVVVVEEVGDLWALERAQAFNGHYHVLGGVLSALDGVTPDDLNLKGLWGWTEQPGVAYAAFVPEDPDKVSSCGCDTCCAAEPMSVLWLEGEDRTGALDDSLQAIAAAGIGIRNGVALAAGGRYAGVLVFADEADLDKALAVLGECCA